MEERRGGTKESPNKHAFQDWKLRQTQKSTMFIWLGGLPSMALRDTDNGISQTLNQNLT